MPDLVQQVGERGGFTRPTHTGNDRNLRPEQVLTQATIYGTFNQFQVFLSIYSTQS